MKIRPLLGTVMAAVGIGVLFQNCGGVSMTETLDSSSLNSLEAQDRQTDIQFKEVTVLVDVNQTKRITLIEKSNFKGEITFENGEKSLSIFEKGALSILNSKTGEIEYVPEFGFRGSFPSVIKIKYDDLKQEIIKINFEVKNPSLSFKPALAVRAAECILCHAQIKGDVISDLGYKNLNLDSQNTDVFFKDYINANGQHLGSAFSAGHTADDHKLSGSGWGTAAIVGKVVVPYVKFSDLPTTVPRNFLISRDYSLDGQTKTAETLSEYLENVIIPKVKSSYEVNRTIIEKAQVYIGTPTEDQIKQAGRLSVANPLRFVRNENESPELSGFKHIKEIASGKSWQDFYTNVEGEIMVCEGDVFVDGVVWLKDAKIRTEYGCRIHATKSIFITGPIEYDEEGPLTNLQIMSARGIFMGFGECYNCRFNGDLLGPGYEKANTVPLRVGGKEGVRGYGSNHGAMVKEDFNKISKQGDLLASVPASNVRDSYLNDLQSKEVLMIDAFSHYPVSASGTDVKVVKYDKNRNWALDAEDAAGPDIYLKKFSDDAISYRRLLLNAPDVQSRYTGNFQGTVIAEYALWRLGKFSFKFDPVFKGVSIFPLMDMKQILQIKDQ